MKVADAQKDQTALQGLIRIFENMIVQAVEATASTAFEPLMVIDMRFGMFAAFIISLRADGTVYGIPRPLEVEEAHQIPATRLRTPMCAYRKKKTQNWIVCSEGRLKEKVSEPEFEVVESVLDYGLTLPENDRLTFVRLWHAFLGRLTSTDSGQDYNRVIFVVDNGDVVPIIEQSIPLVGEKIDKSKGDSKWQSALVVCIDATLDISGFAFLNTPRDLQVSQGLYLLLRGESSAVEAAFEDSQFSYASMQSIALSKYHKIAIVGVTTPAVIPQNMLYFPNEDQFQNACLTGYLHWWLQIDGRRVEELRQRYILLEQQLATKKKETEGLVGLLNRLKTVLQHINQQ